MHIKNETLSPMKAIRAKCLDCCCGSAYEVQLCPAEDCPLHRFRLGHNPNITKRVLTDEQRATLAERFRKAREARLMRTEEGTKQ